GGAAETSFRGSLGRQRRFSGIGAPDEGCRGFERDPGMPEKSPGPPEGTDVHGDTERAIPARPCRRSPNPTPAIFLLRFRDGKSYPAAAADPGSGRRQQR
ncbi:unnamed protein product, partial [Ectocarpus fasciculatus]